MIYLIESSNYYKIGFTTDLDTRIKSYITANPDFRLIDTKIGSKQDETNLHKLCKKYKYKNEWFFKNEEILNIWNSFIPENKNTSKESDHFIVYTDNLSSFYNLKSENARKLLVWLCCHAEWNTGEVNLTAADRSIITEELKICNNTITNNLQSLKKLNLISGEKGKFIINPQIFWKGDTKTRGQLLKDGEIKIKFSIE